MYVTDGIFGVGTLIINGRSFLCATTYVSVARLDAQDDSPSGSSVSISVAESRYTAVTVTPVDYYIYGVLCMSKNHPSLVLLPQ